MAIAAIAAVLLAAVVAGVLLARGGGDRRCGREVREPLDARSLQHVLAGADPPTFGTAAPTSGPHQGSAIQGIAPGPLAPVVQVGVLERGGVLVQHRAAGPGALAVLARADVVVAPNPSLDAEVVVTAWQVRMRCEDVDVARIARFVDANLGKGPESSHGP